jgi:predicted ferric reductase
MTNSSKEPEYQSSFTGESLLVLTIAVGLGLLAAIIVVPAWLPGLAASLTGSSPKAYWYLSRATAFVAMGILWGSMMLGVGITNKAARLWPGAPAAFALHEYLSLLGLAFAGFHAFILLGDLYSKYALAQLLIPFAAGQYRPFWVGLGQLSFYSMALVILSFYIRRQIGQKAWRLLHFVSFLTYLGALVHSVTAGTDVSLPWAQGFYWITGGSFLFLLMYRIINGRLEKIEKAAKRPAHQ